MNCFESLQHSFFDFLQKEFSLSFEIMQSASFDLNCDEKKEQFGDISTNAAMIIAKHLKKNPRSISEVIIEKFKHPFIEKMESAGPGFLNFFMTNNWYQQLATEIESEQESFFSKQENKIKNKINIEFVSANPTGPLHIGHGRNGILGDVLATIQEFLGHHVSREFYINDAGAQITKLGLSLKIRCLQELGHSIDLFEDAYQGTYLIDVAKKCVTEFGINLTKEPDSFFETYAKEQMISLQQTTLEQYGIIFQTWFSEKSLHDHGKVITALERLIKTGHTYEQDNALWFRSTTFGDDKDRVLKKSDGQLTYVAADIAYLIDKFERGFTQLYMILGHDHHSYKTRLHAIMVALGYDPEQLTIILYQLVHVFQDGQAVKMSKRTGKMITLSDIVDEVGKNAARFFFLNRKADAELEFNINLAISQSNENPIFYIQYAHVRTHSLCCKAEQENISAKSITNSTEPFTTDEKMLLKKICFLKRLLSDISKNHQIHLIAYYTYELATLFHHYYNLNRIIDPLNKNLSSHRMAIVLLVQKTLQTCFYLMGITPLSKM